MSRQESLAVFQAADERSLQRGSCSGCKLEGAALQAARTLDTRRAGPFAVALHFALGALGTGVAPCDLGR